MIQWKIDATVECAIVIPVQPMSVEPKSRRK